VTMSAQFLEDWKITLNSICRVNGVLQKWDFIETDESVYLTIPLRFIESKDDIQVSVSEYAINLDLITYDLHLEIPVSRKLDVDDAHSTFRNGVLDIEVKFKES